MRKFAMTVAASSWASIACPCHAQVSAPLDSIPANTWVLQEDALIGPDRPIALVWSPEADRFLSLGWISDMYGRRAPYTYDELALDAASGRWENWFPPGKDWGARFGPCKPPGWKEGERFRDVEGNVRPNWAAYYWLLGASSNFAYLPEEGKFLFYVDGHTFAYDPARREWTDLAAGGDPQRSTPLRSRLLWGSMCYDEARDRVVLFGGGNSDTERGDPGTWLYAPATNTWSRPQLDLQPPPRANSRLAYDAERRKVILFGGDQLDRTTADTWAFDGTGWTRKSPALSPSPRAGHALLWLPKARKLLLLGGYTVSSATEYCSFPYRSLPLEAWAYDEGSDVWQLLRRFEFVAPEGEESGRHPAIPGYRPLQAAVDRHDRVALVDDERRTWLCRIDARSPDAAGTAEHGVPPGTVDRRTGPYDPAWYLQDIPAVDPAKVKSELEALPANRWVLRPTPKRPSPNMDWGSAVFSPEQDKILRFSGGHSAYSGTAPHVYDIATDRFSLPFEPEFPIDWCFSNDQVPGEWSFKGNPWMTGHTYKSTGYDGRLKCMVFGPHEYTYFFDPLAGTWTRGPEPNPYRPDFYTVTMVPTPEGLVVWAYSRQGPPGLWRLRPGDRTWSPLPHGDELPRPVVDLTGAVHDSRRDRLLFFGLGDDGIGWIAACNHATGKVSSLAATGAEEVAGTERGEVIFRESVYLPRDDVVLVGATGRIYDCVKDAWFKASIPSDEPEITKEGPYNIGVVHDPNRDLVWAVNTNGQVFALKLDISRAALEPVARSWEPGIVNSIGMKLVRIEAGEFTMGAGEEPPRTRAEWDARDHDEAPAHRVEITRPFHMSATEVTNAQYERFDREHRKLRGLHGVSAEDDHPVVMVGWQQAVGFCKWLSKEEGRTYRLPTEAEWEYACRAGTTTPYSTGETLAPERANFGAGPRERRPCPVGVGSFEPNAWGLHDMHGNVAEWCHDWYGPYASGRQVDPVGRADGWARVVRGWSYQRANHRLGAARYCRSSNRSGFLPEDANRTTGFRVVLGPMPATEPLPPAEPPIHQRDVRREPVRAARDPGKPSFEHLSRDVRVPADQWGPIFGHWNHFSAIAACPNGDVLAVWYTTVAEEGPECAQAAARLRADTGTWDPPSFFFGTPDCNTHAPVPLSDGVRLYHFCTQSLSGWDDAAECMRTSDDSGATWSRPRIILSREHPRTMSQPCSAIVAKDGRIVLAVDGDHGHRDERVMTSGDGGITWTVGEGDMRKAVGAYAIHPALVERRDGAYLAFLRGPDPMPVVVSTDAGGSWAARPTPLPGIGVGQKAAALKLASGALLLCSFDSKREILGGGRGELPGTYAALSLDDGRTWSHVRKVEGPLGYLSATQAADGTIYLLGLGNPRVHCVAFNEAWLREGEPLE